MPGERAYLLSLVHVGVLYVMISVVHQGIALLILDLGGHPSLIGVNYALHEAALCAGSILLSRAISRLHVLFPVLSSLAPALVMLIALSSSAMSVIILFLILGLCFAVALLPLTYMLIRVGVESERVVKALAVPQSIGTTAGFLLGYIALKLVPLGELMTLTSAISTILVLTSICLYLGFLRARSEVTTFAFERPKAISRRALFTSTLFQCAGVGAFLTVLPPLMRFMGFKDDEIYLYRLIAAITSSTSHVLLVKHIASFDRAARSLSYSIASRTVILSMPIIALHYERDVMYVVAVLMGLTWTLINISLKALAVNQRSAAYEIMGELFISNSIGLVVGSLVASALVSMGLEVSLLTSSAMMTLSFASLRGLQMSTKH